ncbi:ABC transporter permease [Tenacibaculum sp. IB213877]|uniref:ABC transporter permease n=1 Tax=Tenacibaculum sp. IB213877 TaxID=3097351 RepID=UPI002A5AF646|nr:ABC transporter permease [Tenacibaculum sp. IB213877]MDY0780939.1 FtsX-like permease family protein [Tenacibaculum sp. IB213877]
MNFPFYIAKRYLFSKNSTNAINIITIIAMIGVMVGALALFVILSGFSGLRTFSYSLLNASDPDIKITASKGKSFLFSPEIKNELEHNSEIKTYSRVLEERIFLKYKDKNQIAYIKGVDANYNHVVPIDSSLTLGTWIDTEFKNTAVIGYGISYKLSLSVFNFGEPLEIYVPKPGKGFLNVNNAFNKVNVQIIGAYTGAEEYQNKYVFTELGVAQKLLKYEPDQVSAIELKLTNLEHIDNVRDQLQKKIGNEYNVETRAQLNALFYKVINTENFVSYLIFTLIIIIALFNVIGAMIMMIIDKKKNLITLFNLGANLNEVKKIFVIQGFLLTLIGMTIGLVLATILVVVQQQFGVFMITQSIPYPVEFKISNLLIVMLTITILGYFASKIASSRISINFIANK